MEGGAGWSATGFEHRAMVMSHEGSTPSLSATEDEPIEDRARLLTGAVLRH